MPPSSASAFLAPLPMAASPPAGSNHALCQVRAAGAGDPPVRPQFRLPAAGALFDAPVGLTFRIIKSRGGRRIARTRAV
ncbi:hypothetical protein RGR602_PC01720 (plasmid) [Rhizobium gallicum bv. gallicum R602sp]|uniref:Uncharacterized protein n=1 Tax=Rhizobium gallicum bv. gallicum R602sp TaxID=1041138 RepID=A0A0B4XCJ9_9HYPH|nr:hypothetical protein RGR602_PC01720 [Rhizobium gallicum bv. gallicum R602sp]